jgi:hypothetical protein
LALRRSKSNAQLSSHIHLIKRPRTLGETSGDLGRGGYAQCGLRVDSSIDFNDNRSP